MQREATYHAWLEAEVDDALQVATAARASGGDPVPRVEIPIATDMADRVENLLGFDGIADRIRELEGEMSRERAALDLARAFAEGELGSFDDADARIEAAVRTAVALLTEGVVAAPIEGIDRVALEQAHDGSTFVRIWYAGPIRSAGGTAQALSVLVADYTRHLLGFDAYRPTDDEVGRLVEEIQLYERETGLQYMPTEDEIIHIAEHCPVMLDGEPTTEDEVDSYRDLDRIDTNRGRGGMCLVLAEGIAQKANKLARYVDELDEVEWPWLDELRGEGNGEEDGDTSVSRVDPDKGYLKDLIAGRPVLSHPSEPGGFRLRYGRARNHGLATAGVHPATMHLVDDFLAPGTQLKTERPGKAAGVIPTDTVDGPVVRMGDGSVRRLTDPEEVQDIRSGVVEIIDLGEYLVNVGEFVENNHPLVPGAYDRSRWALEMEAAGADLQAARDAPDVSLDDPSPARALRWAAEFDAPLHPRYTYAYHDLTVDELEMLGHLIEEGTVTEDGLTIEGSATDTLARLLVEHQHSDECCYISVWQPLVRTLGFDDDLARSWASLSGDDPLEAINEIAPFTVRPLAPTRIGARVGRPEKSESRSLNPAVHGLFPVGAAGGDRRSVEAAASFAPDRQSGRGTIEIEVNHRRCPSCETETFRARCPTCDSSTELQYTCPSCEIPVEEDESGRYVCERCDREARATRFQQLDIDGEYDRALEVVGRHRRHLELLKGVRGLTSATKTPEPLEKGILRAAHDLTVFKDGTIRYDMTDLPVTAIRPEEVGVDVDTFRELGYETDIDGEPLQYDDQVIELFPQDILLSHDAADHLFRTANFVDDLLESYYDLEPFYQLEQAEDLVGELILGLAPHTSAAVTGRIVGFTSASVGYAHPFFHAAKRRNCFHPETKIWYRNEQGEWRHESIECVVEDRIEDPQTDDFGTMVQDIEGAISVPSMNDEGEFVAKPVSAVSKHRSPDHLVRIKTRTGRSIVVTPDHEIHVSEGDEVIEKKASEVTTDDFAIAPDHLELIGGESETIEFDLLEEFLDIASIDVDRLMINGLDKDDLYQLFESKLLTRSSDEFHPLRDTADHLGIHKKTFSKYIYRERFPVGLLLKVFDSKQEFLEFVPRDVKLTMRHDRAELPRIIRLNEGVAALIGLYTAGGFARVQDTSKGTVHQTTFCGTEVENRHYFMDVLRNEFGVQPYFENHAKVTVSGSLLRTFIDTVLDAGIFAETKRVPQPIFDSPDSVVTAYLNGYFCGNGTVRNDGSTISATTISLELKEDLIALLSRLGIHTTVYEKKPVPLHEKFPEFYDEKSTKLSAKSYIITISSDYATRFAQQVGFHLSRKQNNLNSLTKPISRANERVSDGGKRGYFIDGIEEVEKIEATNDFTYCLTVEDTHSLVANNISTKQCDGDEDCVMLLMDGLLNFSESYLPSNRGGRMDAPLVLSTRIDPAEIDDEAHNIETSSEYPLELYEAADRYTEPSEIDIPLAKAEVDAGGYPRFGHTDDPTDLAAGPPLSAYKTLDSMEDKLNGQLELARKIRAVDEADVAERVIEGHYLPDLLGNLRAFVSQETRCRDCETKFRRVPLTGSCPHCGGTVSLTVYEGMVSKYLEPAQQIAEQYDVRPYTRQRLEVLDHSLSSLFEDDTNKQAGIADFM